MTAAPSSGPQPRSPLAVLCLAVLLFLCVVYYFAFAVDVKSYIEDHGTFQFALNAHDHFIYVDNISLLMGNVIAYGLNNNVGIAAIYVALGKVAPFLVDPEYVRLSLVVNCCAIVLSYALYARICDKLDLGTVGKLSFFANLYFIYFAQLVNKDMLTVFVFLLCVWSGLRRQYALLMLMLPIWALIRQQLAVFVLIYIFLMRAKRVGPRFALVYVVTSVAGGVLSVFANVISPETLGDGLSAWLVTFNQKYYIGYLLFNPLRVVQYVTDAYSSFSFLTPDDGIDLAKLLRVPELTLLALFLPQLAQLPSRFGRWMATPARALVIAVAAYLVTWLMNPTINARYVMLITPVLALFALYVYRLRSVER